MRVTVPIISWNECQAQINFISSNTLCTTGSLYGKGSCAGDSGGPLASLRNNTGQWVQMGVVVGGDCPAGVNIFGNVVQHRKWIRNVFK